MNIMTLFLIGLSWVLAAALILTVIAGALMATWMQVNDGKETKQ